MCKPLFVENFALCLKHLTRQGSLQSSTNVNKPIKKNISHIRNSCLSYTSTLISLLSFLLITCSQHLFARQIAALRLESSCSTSFKFEYISVTALTTHLSRGVWFVCFYCKLLVQMYCSIFHHIPTCTFHIIIPEHLSLPTCTFLFQHD